ncbi:unnamed protein product [Malus baccata var. baccata]
MNMMNSSRNKLSYMSSVVVLVLCLNSKAAHVSTASGNIISQGQSISGNQTISSSPRGIFELGFFTPGNSHNHYIGIWYKKLQKTVVWVANRNHPVSDPFSSSLQLFPNGTLILLDQSKSSIWSTTRDLSVASNSTSEVAAVLLDNGNFVITDTLNSSAVIWQSFDHPTDTWLPGGKLGYNKLTNEKLTLTPWRSSQNPAPGIFSLEIERNGTSFLLMYNGTKMYWTSGPWTGKIFKYVPEIQLNYLVTNISYKSDEFGSYVSYDAVFPDIFIRYMLDISGQFRAYKDFSRIITTMQGTRGYIAPEWISGEAITAKADVFSYGMLCFEIISGRRNRDLLDDGLQNYFPTCVANVLTKGEDVDTLLDCRLEGNANKEEVMRACKVACWCIQDDENDRPTMGQVVQLLEGVIDLGIPPIPQFLDRFSKSLVESIHYHNISSSTASDSRRGYSSRDCESPHPPL